MRKIAIYGTGTYYEWYRRHLEEQEIRYLIDSDINKQGMIIDGIIVQSPQSVDYEQCDYILILVKNYHEIKQQLLDYGVSENKILSYDQIDRVAVINVMTKDGRISLADWNTQNRGRRIMLVSHDLSRSGVPVALMNLAILLKQMGNSVLYVSMGGGGLGEELLENDIDHVGMLHTVVNGQDFRKNAKDFDFFVLGTSVLSKYVSLFAQFGRPVIWWMHESLDKYFDEFVSKLELPENISLFAGGERVVKAIKKHFNIHNVSKLNYFLPDKGVRKKRVFDKEKLVFALVGAVCRRKAQDVLVDAIRCLEPKVRENCEFIFVGSVIEEDYFAEIKKVDSKISMVGEVSMERLQHYYETMDVLICPSRDDPMPIVVTEAMQYGIPCIVSDEVGQSEFIIDKRNGFVFRSEDAFELAEKIKWVLEHKGELGDIGEGGVSIFKKYFSKERMKEEISTILSGTKEI